MKYKLTKAVSAGTIVQTDDQGITSFVPADPANRHFAAYKDWTTKKDNNGNPNQPVPADP